MFVFVLHRHWDTPDNEGNEIMGAYEKIDSAIADMAADAAATKAYYPADYWENDMTWEDDCEIHLGRSSSKEGLATTYCWEVKKVEVQ